VHSKSVARLTSHEDSEATNSSQRALTSVSGIRHRLQCTRPTPTRARRLHKKVQCPYLAPMLSQKTSRGSDLPRKPSSMLKSMGNKELRWTEAGLHPIHMQEYVARGCRSAQPLQYPVTSAQEVSTESHSMVHSLWTCRSSRRTMHSDSFNLECEVLVLSFGT